MGVAPLSGHLRRAERAARRAAGILLIAATCRPHQTVPPSPATVGGVAPITPAQVDTVPGARRPGGICTAERRAGIILDIQDSVTGAPLALRALVVAMHGTQVDSVRHLRAPTDLNEDADERRLRIWLAWEQAGCSTLLFTCTATPSGDARTCSCRSGHAMSCLHISWLGSFARDSHLLVALATETSRVSTSNTRFTCASAGTSGLSTCSIDDARYSAPRRTSIT